MTDRQIGRLCANRFDMETEDFDMGTEENRMHVVVVGGGIVGLACAYSLAERALHRWLTVGPIDIYHSIETCGINGC